MDEARDKSDRWFATIEEGETLHYDYGHCCFVRCILVSDALHFSEFAERGKPFLMPLAIVGGSWSPEQGCVPVNVERWRKSISSGQAFQPNAQFVYESPFYYEPERPDPRSMELY